MASAAADDVVVVVIDVVAGSGHMGLRSGK